MPKKKLFDIFKSIFVDSASCILCDAELEFSPRFGLCPECESKLEFIGDKCCIRCGKPAANESMYCLTCQNEKRYFDIARSAVVYDGGAAELIRALKFQNGRYLAEYLAKFLDYAVEYYGIRYDAAVSVPISAARYKERRYNQTEEMLRYSKIGPVIPGAIVKTRENKQQSLIGGKERRDNVKNAFSVAACVKGKRILIVDDIITTGATINEIARKLLRAGAASVAAVSAAHARYCMPGEEETLTPDYETIDLASLITGV